MHSIRSHRCQPNSLRRRTMCHETATTESCCICVLPGGLHHVLKCVPCSITSRCCAECRLACCGVARQLWLIVVLTASQDERMRRKAPRAALPKPKMHPPGLAITGGYRPQHIRLRYTRCATYSTPQRHTTCDAHLVYDIRQGHWRSTCSTAHNTPRCSLRMRRSKGLPGTH